jgi:adenylate cyclase
MPQEGFKRKLTAILSADVIGYSRLMRDDEEDTVRDLAANRVLISKIIQQNNGRVVDSPGDNILAEFASVVDAVNGAIKIHDEIRKNNIDIPADRRMEFRIGINLGDVIEEEERIYGDGVNIAARVERLAAGGGIAISGTVYEHIKQKLSLGYHYLGEQNVKNISEPVRVYRLLTEPADAGKMIGEEKTKAAKWLWVSSAAIALILLVIGVFAIWDYYFHPSFEPASEEMMAFPLPDKPSVAVMAFDNLSGDPEQDLFCDSIAENIITQLSRIHSLFVISHGSSFSFKGKNVKVLQVSQELGVRYLLKGSVQGSGERLRITAQLIDAINGRHLWAEKYDREPKDLFAIQDEITNKVVMELAGQLTEGEMSRLEWQLTKNTEAFNYWIRARGLFRRFQREENFKARQLLKKAVELDPEFSAAYSLIGWSYAMSAEYGWSENPALDLKKVEELLKKAVEVDASNTNFDKYNLWGFLYLIKREYNQAIEQGKLSIKMAPGIADSHAILANSLLYAGQPEEAIMEMKKAMRLAPFYPSWFLKCVGQAYLLTGRYEEAILAFKEYIERPYSTGGHVWLAIAYSSIGKEDRAQVEAERVLKSKPTFSLKEWGGYNRQLYKDAEVVDRFLGFARNAGLPEYPPPKLPDRPSIAVLPFDNLSNEPEQEYFSDGLTDEIITTLSKSPRLFVIARESVFSYKAKQIQIYKVSRELGVRYVLEGSVRKSEDRLRITAQLIDAITGQSLWSERFEKPLGEIFAIQDEITLSILRALQVKLSEGEQARLIGKKTENLDAYLKAIQAQEQFFQMNRQGSMRAKELAKESIDLDPSYAFPYTTLANAHMLDVWFKFSKSPVESMKLAVDAAEKALIMNDSDPVIYSTLTNLYVMQRQYDKAISSARQAIELSPGGARAHISMGYALFFSCRFEEAIPFFEQAIRLNPYPPGVYFRSS